MNACIHAIAYRCNIISKLNNTIQNLYIYIKINKNNTILLNEQYCIYYLLVTVFMNI